MNLISKINRYFIFSSTLLFVVIFIAIYFLIDMSIRKESDQQLKNITKKVINELKEGGAVDYPPFIEIDPVDIDTIHDKRHYFEDVLIDFSDTEVDEPFRQMISYTKIDDKYYRVTARISMEAKKDMFQLISIVIFSGILLFIIIMFFINKKLSTYIFTDLYATLKKIESFSITVGEKLVLKPSNINEFKKLNSAIMFLADKAQKEYLVLKEFTEELNHEIQTPISVVKSKLELLIQSPSIDDDSFVILDSALKSLSKLEKINRSILLLNKLENADLYENSQINLKEEIIKILENFEDFKQFKNINLTYSEKTKNKPVFLINSSLFNILISNLISNAIKHSTENGEINIKFNDLPDKTFLTISNTSQKLQNPQNFFKRFYKESDSAESTGLGLAIVKKICDIYHIEISNSYKDNIYSVELIFPKKYI